MAVDGWRGAEAQEVFCGVSGWIAGGKVEGERVASAEDAAGDAFGIVFVVIFVAMDFVVEGEFAVVGGEAEGVALAEGDFGADMVAADPEVGGEEREEEREDGEEASELHGGIVTRGLDVSGNLGLRNGRSLKAVLRTIGFRGGGGVEEDVAGEGLGGGGGVAEDAPGVGAEEAAGDVGGGEEDFGLVVEEDGGEVGGFDAFASHDVGEAAEEAGFEVEFLAIGEGAGVDGVVEGEGLEFLGGVEGFDEGLGGVGEEGVAAGGVDEEEATVVEVGFEVVDVVGGEGDGAGAGEVGEGAFEGVEFGEFGLVELEVGFEIALGEFGHARPGAGFGVGVAGVVEAGEVEGAGGRNWRGSDGEGVEVAAGVGHAMGVEVEGLSEFETIFAGVAAHLPVGADVGGGVDPEFADAVGHAGESGRVAGEIGGEVLLKSSWFGGRVRKGIFWSVRVRAYFFMALVKAAEAPSAVEKIMPPALT